MVMITSAASWHAAAARSGTDTFGRGRSAGRSRLMIVEDDPVMRLALACMVVEDGWQIVTADSAEQALEYLPLVDPDAVVCGDLLDGMNGREFCRCLRNSRRWNWLPVIAVTASRRPSSVRDLLRSGADAVVVSPVCAPDLRARVHSSLELRGRALQRAREAMSARVLEVRFPAVPAGLPAAARPCLSRL